MRPATISRSRPGRRALLRSGAAAGPLFVSVFSIEGARRPDYKPLRHPVSSLSLGPRGWVQAANFATTGMLYLAGAAGLARTPGQPRAAGSRQRRSARPASACSARPHSAPTLSAATRPEHPTLPPRPPR
jgi:hypothetical protein